ncbi:uncharacterized protein SPSK_07495 [Sporothrix schenckii 1099-18]|uniref:Uncharacterized protein n=1 Tax=Sporothrix schenckii 1099-18 TaxID=1397361 RepID=A0A0F2MIV7_SPOSC|nr:uncharacterized protein SPSK_07495 [Sporothrix schenckii 1099-18]KJR88984.1 hypothetical protein SPSK_07495 [Sporothrix schenckii 1099-18]
MEDPDIAWPAWKFGMKRDALFTTLHKQYNTFQSTIQDPDAFHHDVFEIANEATTTGEFHNLLAVRRDQRLRELNESLESASFEIIANPDLVGTTQWEQALQLFRTRSLDSLVRYFASYLPSSHPWHKASPSSSGQNTEIEAKSQPPVAAVKPFFDDASFTQEPMAMTHSLSHTSLHHDLPPSPRSLTTYSDDMETSSHQLYCLNTLTPARTLSFDSNEGDRPHDIEDGDAAPNVDNDDDDDEECPSQFDDDTSQSSGPDTPVSMSDAEPDVAEEESPHHSPAEAYATTMQELVDTTTPESKTPPTPVTNQNQNQNQPQLEAIANAATPTTTAHTTDATIGSGKSHSSSPYRRPLQPGLAVNDSCSASPLPVMFRDRHRSVSPSARPWPVAHVDAGRHHPAAPSGIIATCGRASDRSSRQGRIHRLDAIASSSTNTRRASSCGRRRPGLGVEKTALPRPMRTRFRGRREAAASAAVDERERQ